MSLSYRGYKTVTQKCRSELIAVFMNNHPFAIKVFFTSDSAHFPPFTHILLDSGRKNNPSVLRSGWNVMAHGDAQGRKWRGKWRMEWVASILFTLPRNMVYPALLPLMRTPRLPVVDWTDAPRRFKWTRPFRRKTKSGFSACVITF